MVITAVRPELKMDQKVLDTTAASQAGLIVVLLQIGSSTTKRHPYEEWRG